MLFGSVVILLASQASAQWWVGGNSFALRADKYDSFFGEARRPLWSVQRPPGTHWKEMLASKRLIAERRFASSNGYPAIYSAGYPATYFQGLPEGMTTGYHRGFPWGYPVDSLMIPPAHPRTPTVQVMPVKEEEDELPIDRR
ncbi:MAG: hypothetical protein MI861_08290 [Pirellulales bacterium]|nr:hypothetical protein [Pirellulales bacterium]